MHLAGAKILRGPMGFGKSSRMQMSKILRLFRDQPIVIEIVESEQKILAFLPILGENRRRFGDNGEGAGAALPRHQEGMIS